MWERLTLTKAWQARQAHSRVPLVSQASGLDNTKQLGRAWGSGLRLSYQEHRNEGDALGVEKLGRVEKPWAAGWTLKAGSPASSRGRQG